MHATCLHLKKAERRKGQTATSAMNTQHGTRNGGTAPCRSCLPQRHQRGQLGNSSHGRLVSLLAEHSALRMPVSLILHSRSPRTEKDELGHTPHGTRLHPTLRTAGTHHHRQPPPAQHTLYHLRKERPPQLCGESLRTCLPASIRHS